MKEVYRKLLKSAGFEIENNVTEWKLDFAVNKDKCLYYLIGDFKDEDELKKSFNVIQEEGYNFIASKEDGNIIKKNCYFIVLIKNDNSNNIKKITLEIEESSLYFKKNVLSYFDEEIDSLNDILAGISFEDLVREKTYDAKLFKDFKDKNFKNFYSLLLKIIIKSPHLSLINQKKGDYPLLSLEIEKELEKLGTKFEIDLKESDEVYINKTFDTFKAEIDYIYMEGIKNV